MQPLRIHYLQHVPFEGPGTIKDWVKERNHKLSVTRFYRQDTLPGLDELDWLIIMGGPMGVYQEEKYSWLAKEKKFISKAIDSGKTVIGICLGAQLIADALGARVIPNEQKEIGWFPIQTVRSNNVPNLLHADELITFHWHSDTFELPQGAVHLAQSDACKNQAFLNHDKVLALQFHPEVTAESINAMLLNGKDEVLPASYVQPENDIVVLNNSHLTSNKKFLFETLDNLCCHKVV